MTQLALVQIADDVISGYRPRRHVIQSVQAVIRGIREIMEDRPDGTDGKKTAVLVSIMESLAQAVEIATQATRDRPRRKFQQVQAGEYPSLCDACDALGMLPPASEIKPDTVVRLRARDSGRPCGKAYAYPSGNGGVVIDYDTNQTARFLTGRVIGNLSRINQGGEYGNL